MQKLYVIHVGPVEHRILAKSYAEAVHEALGR